MESVVNYLLRLRNLLIGQVLTPQSYDILIVKIPTVRFLPATEVEGLDRELFCKKTKTINVYYDGYLLKRLVQWGVGANPRLLVRTAN